MSREEELIKESIDEAMKRDINFKDYIFQSIEDTRKATSWTSFRQKIGIALQLLILITCTLIYIDMQNKQEYLCTEVYKAIIDAFRNFNNTQ